VTSGRFPGLVLAAGLSRRMPGRSKLGRAWLDTTVLGAVIRSATEAQLDPLFVAISGDTPDLELTDIVSTVRVPKPEDGKAESLAAGLSAMQPGAVVVLLGDEPGIRVSDIQALTTAWDESAADMARVRYTDRPGHPVLLGPRARAQAEKLGGDIPIWETLGQEGFTGVEVVVNVPAPIDVDSPAELRRARRRETVE